jgi:pimeloyl-ACP methyl ester carboxylesterase
MPFPYLGETLQLNPTTRANASGSFVQLTDGVTHYELGGPEDGAPVVLVHGFSTPYFIFDPTFNFLTQSGFRVLRYDLVGRGWSDRPRQPYNVDLFVRQLDELLDALRLSAPLSLVGLSMGGIISAAFTVRRPERIARNILIDPAGTHPVKLGLYQALTLPLVGELALGLVGGETILKRAAADFFDPALIEIFQDKYRTQMQFAGFRRAILSSVRSGMLDDFSDTYRSLRALNKPTLLIWGANDTTVPFAHSADLCALLAQAEFHVIENSGHIPHYEQPQAVNPVLLKFLKS